MHSIKAVESRWRQRHWVPLRPSSSPWHHEGLLLLFMHWSTQGAKLAVNCEKIRMMRKFSSGCILVRIRNFVGGSRWIGLGSGGEERLVIRHRKSLGMTQI